MSQRADKLIRNYCKTVKQPEDEVRKKYQAFNPEQKKEFRKLAKQVVNNLQAVVKEELPKYVKQGIK